MPRIRSAIIGIKDQKLCLMHRFKNNKEYYAFPGGGKEPGETLEQTALRELTEETSLTARIDRLLYIQTYDDQTEEYFYSAKDIQGEIILPADSIEYKRSSEANVYEPMWVDIKEISQIALYPLEIRDELISDIKNNFQNCPKRIYTKLAERRS